MGCQLHPSNPQILTRLPTKKPPKSTPFLSSFQPNCRTQRTIFSSSSSHNQQQSISTYTITQQRQSPETGEYSVKFKTREGCKLGISRYPDFDYNAEGGTGDGTVTTKIDEDDSNIGEVSVSFDLERLYIPPLMSATTRFLGLPLPPFLKIDVVPELLQGIISRKSGKVDLQFKAKFWFSIGSIYRAPPLLVETVLTSEESKGRLRSGTGERLNEEGKCRLVGVATVDPIDDPFMDSFLRLPTECLAVLNATISFSAA
ncbi:Auxin transport protein like [Actinidia chinensis var. chinensis]|uniref:Auxin transport protein like n=1 Tax=Actinidia chinensis var. chinensis TaxID=1590841 RepID=A0A2R6RQX2_ACTCC|nr:Auxin transport protein like [Actinidia chinensis var. chinensis]